MAAPLESRAIDLEFAVLGLRTAEAGIRIEINVGVPKLAAQLKASAEITGSGLDVQAVFIPDSPARPVGGSGYLGCGRWVTGVISLRGGRWCDQGAWQTESECDSGKVQNGEQVFG